MNRETAYKAQEEAINVGLLVTDAVIKEAHEQIKEFGVLDFGRLEELARDIIHTSERKSKAFTCLFCMAAMSLGQLEKDTANLSPCPLCILNHMPTATESCISWSFGHEKKMDYVYQMKMKLLNAQYTLRKTGRWI